jgi:hypothetical protein
MLSNLVASMKDMIKSETELYTMRIQQQLNRYCNMIENASGIPQNNLNYNNNYQEQLDSMKESIAMILNELYSKNYEYNDLNEPMSPISESNIDTIESDDPIIVNKLPSEELKVVHIDLLKSSDVEESNEERYDTPVLEKKEIIIKNEDLVLVSAEIDNKEVVTNTVTVDPVVEKEVDVVDEDEGEEEEEEEEGQDLEVEEIEYKGINYYKDPDGNVYEYCENGDVGEAVGTMSKKIPGKVLLYST